MLQFWLISSYTFAVLLFNIPFIRRNLVSKPIMKLMEVLKFLPTISETERTAIDAGTVWMDGELFSGKPNFKKILSEPYPDLTKDEQDFLNVQVEHLCSIVNDWDVFETKILRKTWDYLRKEGFFGLIIPKNMEDLSFRQRLIVQ